MSHVSSPALSRIAQLFAALGLFFMLAPLAHAARTVDIDDARRLPLGSVVTVKGTVTVSSALFESSTFDKGFGLQDKSGGIYVSAATDAGLRLGDQAEVTGQLAESFGLLILVPATPSAVKHKGHGRPVSAAPRSTGAINESSEGLLVVVEGTITQAVSSDLPYGYKLYINDGSGEIQIFVAASTGIDLSGLTLGQHLRVVGFSAQFDTTYEVQPRVQSDLSTAGCGS